MADQGCGRVFPDGARRGESPAVPRLPQTQRLYLAVPHRGAQRAEVRVYAVEFAPLRRYKTILLPQMKGGFNHMAIDPRRQRLFAAAPADKSLEVVDLATGKPLRSLAGGAAAARFAPELDQLYVARGRTVVLFDGENMNVTATVEMPSAIDELQYDAAAKRLYAGCISAGAYGLSVIALPEGKLLGTIPLPAKPQGIALETGGSRLFANLPSVQQVAVVDRVKQTVLATWPVNAARRNYPIAFDAANRRVFLGCREPASLLVLDAENGKVVASVPIAGDIDELFFDAAHQRIYVTCGAGEVAVIGQTDADHYQRLALLPTAAGARTSAFSPDSGLLCVGVPAANNEGARIMVLRANNPP